MVSLFPSPQPNDSVNTMVHAHTNSNSPSLSRYGVEFVFGIDKVQPDRSARYETSTHRHGHSFIVKAPT